MTYFECCEKIRNKEKVSMNEVQGYWIFCMLHDRVMKNVKYKNKTYEVNFLLRENSLGTLFVINETTCKEWDDACTIFSKIVNNIEDCGNRVSICIDDEYFEIELEILETDE